MKKNIVFLPCRKGSERVPQKNTRTFAGVVGGLLWIKLNELSHIYQYPLIVFRYASINFVGYFLNNCILNLK